MNWEREERHTFLFTLHMEAQLLHVPCLFPCASPQQCLRGSLPPQEEQPEWQRGKLIVFASHSSSKPQKHDYTCIPRHLELVSPQRGNVDTGSTPHRTRCQTHPAQSLAGVGHAEADVLVTLLLWNSLCSTEHFQGKGQKSSVWVLCCTGIQAQAEKRGDPVTPNGTYLEMLETFVLTPSFSLSALHNKCSGHRYLLCNSLQGTTSSLTYITFASCLSSASRSNHGLPFGMKKASEVG